MQDSPQPLTAFPPSVHVYLISQEKFAEAVGLTDGVVNNWVGRGYLPTVKIGKHRLINLLLLNKRLQDGEFSFLNDSVEF